MRNTVVTPGLLQKNHFVFFGALLTIVTLFAVFLFVDCNFSKQNFAKFSKNIEYFDDIKNRVKPIQNKIEIMVRIKNG